MADREEGYYWVRRPNGDFTIGEFACGGWYFCGNEESWDIPGGEVITQIFPPPTFVERAKIKNEAYEQSRRDWREAVPTVEIK